MRGGRRRLPWLRPRGRFSEDEKRHRAGTSVRARPLRRHVRQPDGVVRLRALRRVRRDARRSSSSLTPAGSSASSSVFGVFAAGYVMRLVGGAMFGHIGDRLGRRRALLVSARGWRSRRAGRLPADLRGPRDARTDPLHVLRLVQGLSVGGEFTTSVTYLVEQAPPSRRGLQGSLAGLTAGVGILLGSAVGERALRRFDTRGDASRGRGGSAVPPFAAARAVARGSFARRFRTGSRRRAPAAERLGLERAARASRRSRCAARCSAGRSERGVLR